MTGETEITKNMLDIDDWRSRDIEMTGETEITEIMLDIDDWRNRDNRDYVRYR